MIYVKVELIVNCDNEWRDRSRSRGKQKRACTEVQRKQLETGLEEENQRVVESFGTEGWTIIQDGKTLCPQCSINGFGNKPPED